MKTRIIFLFLIVYSFYNPLSAQNDTTQKNRKIILVGGTAALWAISTTGLYDTWYKDYPSTRFHTFNDNPEWQQMDKAGHFTTAYVSASLGYDAFSWAGFNENTSLWLGSSVGILFLSTIEVMDGFNKQWGFSWGDMAANASGSLLFLLQQKAWKEQRIVCKVSVHSTSLAKLRPDLLGKNSFESIIKDYNGQTYWISVNPLSFLPKQTWIPSWLNIAAGYGAYGMLGGRDNPAYYNNKPLPSMDRYRRYFISPDISLSRLPFRNKTLKSICKTLDFIKVPLPTLEYNENKGLVFYFFYF